MNVEYLVWTRNLPEKERTTQTNANKIPTGKNQETAEAENPALKRRKEQNSAHCAMRNWWWALNRVEIRNHVCRYKTLQE